MTEPVDLIVTNLREVATLAGPPGPRAGHAAEEVHTVCEAAIAVRDGRIVAVAPRREIARAFAAAAEHDGEGAVAMPGFCDPHTHMIFAADRSGEWCERLSGVSYQEIAARGGGIRSSVRSLRAASEDDLVAGGHKRLDRMLAHGTTCAEVKTGYGLSLESEARSLRAIERLDAAHPLHLIPTFLGAHEVPDEFREDREGYIRLLTDEMIPQLASRARFCDVFCEDHVFTVDESRRILLAGRKHGLRPKLHADELASTGGAELAAEVSAISADHLVAASEEGIRRMAEAGVIGVLLPGTAYFLRLGKTPRISAMREHGLPVALATDCNPGSCPTESMGMVLSLASHQYGLTPAEALTAATINAAWAIGEGATRGSLEPGKIADLVLYDADSWRSVAYHFGVSLVRQVFTGGRLVFDRGRRVASAAGEPLGTARETAG
jgi:imidazolonepropionase